MCVMICLLTHYTPNHSLGVKQHNDCLMLLAKVLLFIPNPSQPPVHYRIKSTLLLPPSELHP